jgi:hypothetical protein
VLFEKEAGGEKSAEHGLFPLHLLRNLFLQGKVLSLQEQTFQTNQSTFLDSYF